MTGLADLGLKNFIDLLIYKLLANYRKFNQDLEIDVIQFQKRINKLCQKYSICEKTAQRAFERLVKMELVELVYTLGFGKHVVRVKSLHDLLGQDSSPETKVSQPDPENPNHSNAAQKSSVKQQQLIQVKQICQQAGINYRLEKDWWEIANHGIEKVKATIERMMLQISNPRNPIYNPCGWFKTALRDNYYLDQPDLEDSIPLLEKMLFYSQDKLIELTGCIPA